MSCPKCNDTGWFPEYFDGVRRVVRCDCWREDVAQKMLSKSRIPSRYRQCDFSTFISYQNDELVRAVKKAREFSDTFPAVDKGLIFIGRPGIGKTHLAVSVLREVTEKGMRGVYYDTRSLLSTIKSTYNPVTRASEADILQEVMTAELLVLDDLGAERLTDWVEETMNLIVNTRYNDRLPTIFTSNHEGVPDRENLDSLLCRVGERMYSRLLEMCEFLEFTGPDYREFDFPPSSKQLFQRWKSNPRKARSTLPRQTRVRARARLRDLPQEGQLELGWSGGKAGSS
ncbi:MAG: ATP-binding protein [Acidobacteriota bacterium]|nr:ATP-binding protein [Acidobacteriota bacterium]